MSGADMVQLRTTHGGEDSALCVEVSAWRRDGDGISPCLGYVGGAGVAVHEDITQAHGVGVYLRNPLALHLQDFEPGVGTIDQARAAAFAWADILADHLGCPVVSSLKRPPAIAAPEFDAATLCEVTAALWEAALDLRSKAGTPASCAAARALDWEFENEGSGGMRVVVIGWASECERDWRALSEAEQDRQVWDWEFVPGWLRRKLESLLSSREAERAAWQRPEGAARVMRAGDLMDWSDPAAVWALGAAWGAK